MASPTKPKIKALKASGKERAKAKAARIAKGATGARGAGGRFSY